MKHTIRNVSTLGLVGCFMAFLALSIPAQEFGADLTTQVTIQKPAADHTFIFTQRIDPWFKVPIDSNGSIFQGNGHFGYTDTVPFTTSPVNVESLIGDLDLLRLAFVFPKITPDGGDMHLEFGRLLVQDPTGLILIHPADGLLVGFDYPAVKIGINAGFTGLILRNSSSISVSKLDESLAVNTDQVLGTSRFLALAQIEFPALFLKQTLNLSFLAQQDLNDDANFNPDNTTLAVGDGNQKGGKVNTQYATLTLSGPIVDTLFYDLLFSYGFGQTLSRIDNTASGGSDAAYEYKPISSFLAGLSFDLFTPQFLNGAFNFRFLFASGDGDATSGTEGNTEGNATQFIPLTTPTLGTAFSPTLSNLIVAQIGGTIKPIADARFQTGLKYLAFFRPTVGAIAAVDADPSSTSPWIGQEVDVSASYRLVSDVGLSLNCGFFFPGLSPDGAFNGSIPSQPVQYSIQFSLTLGL